MSKRKVKEAQKVQQYKIGDTLQIKGMDYRVVEVIPDGYHVKNTNPPFNSFIYLQGLDTIQGQSASIAFEDELEWLNMKPVGKEVIKDYEWGKNEPDLLYRPDDRISLNAPSVSEIFKEEQKSSTEGDLGGY